MWSVKSELDSNKGENCSFQLCVLNTLVKGRRGVLISGARSNPRYKLLDPFDYLITAFVAVVDAVKQQRTAQSHK